MLTGARAAENAPGVIQRQALPVAGLEPDLRQRGQLVDTGAAATGWGGDPGQEATMRDRNSFEHVSKGSMLLRRMGWTEGQGLGRRSDGKLQPVQVWRGSGRGASLIVLVAAHI